MEEKLKYEICKSNSKWDDFILKSENKNIYSISTFLNDTKFKSEKVFIKKNDEVLSSFNIYIKNIYLTAALWGIFVGAVIPLLILAGMWVITKRQGMGFGDIQLGFVLGAWLGPMRMALTLFFASFLSLLTWIAVSIFKGFDKDRAIPMAPFLTIAAMSIYIGSFYYPDFFYLLITE